MLRTAAALPRLVAALNVGLMVDTVSTHAGADWLQTLQSSPTNQTGPGGPTPDLRHGSCPTAVFSGTRTSGLLRREGSSLGLQRCWPSCLCGCAHA